MVVRKTMNYVSIIAKGLRPIETLVKMGAKEYKNNNGVAGFFYFGVALSLIAIPLLIIISIIFLIGNLIPKDYQWIIWIPIIVILIFYILLADRIFNEKDKQ